MIIYLGDFVENGSVNFKFQTHDASGALATLAGTPSLAVYESGSTSEITAGVTLSVDYDGVTGLHDVTIDLSNAAYSSSKDYTIVIVAGTVGGDSVVGVALRAFSVGNRTGAVGADLAISSSVDDASATTTQFVAAAGLSAIDDFYNGMLVAFTSGTLAKITAAIVDYDGAALRLTVSPALPVAPSDTDAFLILGRA